MDSILSLSSVSVSFNGSSILNDISLDINPGDFVGIAGPNGAGKSTLIRCILGLQEYSGTIRLFNTNTQNFQAWGRIGYLPQKHQAYAANFPITVRELVLLGRLSRLKWPRIPGKEDEQA